MTMTEMVTTTRRMTSPSIQANGRIPMETVVEIIQTPTMMTIHGAILTKSIVGRIL